MASEAKGLERAKELWTERISSELERASPRSWSNWVSLTQLGTVGREGSWRGKLHFGGERSGKVFELAQLWPNVQFPVLVQQHGQQGLRSAGVLYDLVGEEQILRGSVVITTIDRLLLGARLLLLAVAGGPSEEEDDAVDGASRGP